MILRKFIITAVALVFMAGSALGQSRDMVTVSVSDNLPLLLGSVIGGGVIGSVTDAPAGMEMGDVRTRGCYNIGYLRYINQRVALGGELTYAGAQINFEDKATHKVAETTSANIVMLMAAGKCDYFSRGVFSMGGDLDLGVMTDFDRSTSLAFQVDPIDMMLGTDKAGGFLRIGFGVRGFFTLGFDLNF